MLVKRVVSPPTIAREKQLTGKMSSATANCHPNTMKKRRKFHLVDCSCQSARTHVQLLILKRNLAGEFFFLFLCWKCQICRQFFVYVMTKSRQFTTKEHIFLIKKMTFLLRKFTKNLFSFLPFGRLNECRPLYSLPCQFQIYPCRTWNVRTVGGPAERTTKTSPQI